MAAEAVKRILVRAVWGFARLRILGQRTILHGRSCMDARSSKKRRPSALAARAFALDTVESGWLGIQRPRVHTMGDDEAEQGVFGRSLLPGCHSVTAGQRILLEDRAARRKELRKLAVGFRFKNHPQNHPENHPERANRGRSRITPRFDFPLPNGLASFQKRPTLASMRRHGAFL